MPTASTKPKPSLRDLPSIDEVLRTGTARRIASEAGDSFAAELVRGVVGGLRSELKGGAFTPASDLLSMSCERLDAAWRSELLTGTHRVINATGVVIHTNLGRAPLSENARNAVMEASRYCTLEYDLETGRRGKRGSRAERLLCELTGAESVLIVNNCASAALFVLTVFAGGGEVIISRGEMVEIGGDFRVPDVLSQSGATLREVGTTNRTKLADYEKAINANTRMILRVHPSNYRIVGFTAMPDVADLAGLAKRRGLLLYEDIGSGALLDLSSAGLGDEPVVADSVKAGADIITFSGDKLLGGPQAGIIAGSSEFIEQLRKHPLYRALRVDKLAYAALEATLDSYRRERAFEDIPVLRMLALTREQIARRVEQFTAKLSSELGDRSDLKFEMLEGASAVGGGAAPAVEPDTMLLAVTHIGMSAAKLEEYLRSGMPPVIARIVNDKLMLDLRTVDESEEPQLLAALRSLA